MFLLVLEKKIKSIPWYSGLFAQLWKYMADKFSQMYLWQIGRNEVRKAHYKLIVLKVEQLYYILISQLKVQYILVTIQVQHFDYFLLMCFGALSLVHFDSHYHFDY